MSQMNRRPDAAGRAARSAAGQRPAAGQRAAAGRAPSRPAQDRRAERPGERQRPASREPAPARRTRAPGDGSFGGRSRWVDVAVIAVGGAAVVVLALMLQLRWPTGFPLLKSGGFSSGALRIVSEIYSDGPLRINEIMSCNRRVLGSGDGDTPDWIELANVDSAPLNLRGYSLTKTDNTSSVFTFPDMTLEPQECVLVLADSRLRTDAGDTLHAPFRLSSAGDTLMLFNASGAAIDTVNIPVMEPDSSYVRTGTATWAHSDRPTPGLPNSEDSYRLLSESVSDSPVVLSEIVASNHYALAAEDNLYYDYIELYNRSSEAVDLAGWYLSDDAAEARKWSFPSVSIGPGEHLVVFASMLNRRDDPAHLHTNFSLSSEGEAVVLTDDKGRRMDQVEFGLLKADVAWTLGADGTWSSASPTPGT